MKKRAASVLRLTGIAGAALLVSACGVFSPVQTDYPYIPGDGVALTMPGLDLRNLVVVTEGQGAPGTIVGQAVNEGADAVQVSFALEGGGETRVTVPAFSDDALSLDGSPVVLDAVPDAPGAMVELTVTTPEAGRNVVRVPVLPPTRYYEGLAPAPGASPSS